MLRRSTLHILVLAFAGLGFGSTVWAQSLQGAVFSLEQLPVGAEVTLPRGSQTQVPLKTSVSLTATDMPQSVRLKPVSTLAGGSKVITIALFDRFQERVKYIDLKADTPFIYSFKDIGSVNISVTTGTAKTAQKDDLKLEVTSDKPLSVRHLAFTGDPKPKL